ncbi:MAG TPA: energy transducer TonB [Allosphingosinicella sp.]|jgi:TonB family protein
MPGVYGLIGAAVLAVAMSAPAQGAQAREYREQVGAWEVSTFTPGRCAVTRHLAEGTYLSVSSTRDGHARMTVLNRAWPVRTTDSYELALVQSGSRRSLAARDDGSFQGLSLSAPDGAALLRQLAAGGSVEVTGADGALLGRVDLAGIAPALARLGPCVTDIATAANFPAPAAPPPPPPPPARRRGEARPARAQMTLAQLFSSDDYPASAIRAGEQGAVGFRLDVGKDGRVAACTVTASSGSTALDSNTCRLLSARARFSPALDRKGRATTDAVNGRIVWRLPQPEPEPPPPTS